VLGDVGHGDALAGAPAARPACFHRRNVFVHCCDLPKSLPSVLFFLAARLARRT
jgi:hypothetical protein